MRMLVITILATFTFYCISAMGGEITSGRCDGCDSSQLEAAAIAQGRNTRYVHDYLSGTIYKYTVVYENEPGITPYYWALEEDVEPGYASTFASMKAIYDANGGSTHGFKSVVGPAGSAYDVVDAGPGRNNTINYIAQPTNWGIGSSLLFHYQIVVSSAWGIWTSSPVTITLQVNFPDGSVADFLYTWPGNTVEYIDGSAYDSHGNNIPETAIVVVRPPGSNQSYSFEGQGAHTDLTRMLERFARFGIPVGTGSLLACTRSEAGTFCQFVR